jgi:hypothetical protein
MGEALEFSQPAVQPVQQSAQPVVLPPEVPDGGDKAEDTGGEDRVDDV